MSYASQKDTKLLYDSPKIKGIRFNYFIAFVTANNINLNSFL